MEQKRKINRRIQKINYLLLIILNLHYQLYHNFMEMSIIKKIKQNSLLIENLMKNSRDLEVLFLSTKLTKKKHFVINGVHAQNYNFTKNFTKSLIKISSKEFLKLLNSGKVNFLIHLNNNTTCKKLFLFSYGPFWILTTIVFCLSAVHNILKYQA